MPNPSISRKIEAMDRFTTLDDMAMYLKKYPEICINRYSFAALCRNIPRIVRQDRQETLCCRFIQVVIELYRQRCLASSDLSAFCYPDGFKDGTSNADWALILLELYIDCIVAKTDGLCLKNTYIYQSDLKELTLTKAMTQKDAPFVEKLYYLGWILFLPTKHADSSLTAQAICRYLMSNREFLYRFLKVFIDMTTPTYDADIIAQVMAEIWSSNAIDREWLDETGTYISPFGKKCCTQDVGWLMDKTRDSAVPVCGEVLRDNELTEGYTTLFINLSNIFEIEHFTAENYFFEYLAKIAYEYPLDEERLAITEKYEPYFKSYTPIIVVEFIQDVIDAFGAVKDYRTRPAIDMASAKALRNAEDKVYFIRRAFPDVDADTVYHFFDELCDAFGRGFQGASVGMMCTLEPMIYEIFKKDDEAVASESDLSYIGMIGLCAMEGSYGDPEDMTKPSSQSSNDRASDRDDEPKTTSRVNNLHRRARDDESMMQSGERKIFNAYKKYKNAEEKVDNALTKGIQVIKRALTGDQAAVIIEGKKFSPIGFLKKAILTIGVFNYSKIGAILLLIVSRVLKKKNNQAERQRLLSELTSELEMINEKIEDARGDGNREAKYSLMRTKQAYENAIRRIKFGVSAEVRKEKISETDRQYLKPTLQNRDDYSG